MIRALSTMKGCRGMGWPGTGGAGNIRGCNTLMPRGAVSVALSASYLRPVDHGAIDEVIVALDSDARYVEPLPVCQHRSALRHDSHSVGDVLHGEERKQGEIF